LREYTKFLYNNQEHTQHNLIDMTLDKKTPVSENKYLIVAYKEISNIDGFLITAYFCRKPGNWRTIIWKP